MSDEERSLEAIAMNIVHQIGDALYEALPKDIAHDHFVDARQKTNDVAIDFAKKLIKSRDQQIALAAQLKLVSQITTDKGDAYYQGIPLWRYKEQLEAIPKAQENQDV